MKDMHNHLPTPNSLSTKTPEDTPAGREHLFRKPHNREGDTETNFDILHLIFDLGGRGVVARGGDDVAEITLLE